MDQHPIPQDVTGFQFKLIGSMTVKQFGYVAVGVIAAVIMHYVLPNNGLWVLIKYVILIPISGGSGFVIAFVPVEGRPIDVMASNFIKALFSPNQYVYHKEPKPFSFSYVNLKPPVVPQASEKQNAAKSAVQQKETGSSNKEQQLQTLLMHSQIQPKNVLDQKERVFLDKFSSVYASSGAAPSTAAPASSYTAPASADAQSTHIVSMKETPVMKLPTDPAQLNVVDSHMPAVSTYAPQQQPDAQPVSSGQPSLPPSEDTLNQKEATLEQQLQQAKQEEVQAQASESSPAHQNVIALEKQLQDIHMQKQQLEQELMKLKTQLPVQKLPDAAPTPAPAPQPIAADSTPKAAVPPAPVPTPQPSPFVRNIPQGMTQTAGLPSVSDTPNVVIGIVKDPRGNILPHILIEVKDADGNPVRAFKTNALGQFASATPLANGIYTIELEDPKKQHMFDKIQITTNGQIMMPIEIISHDAREELRKQLFN